MAVIHALIACLGLLVGSADGPLLTVAERSDYRATARHDEVVALCRALAESSERAHFGELGKTTEGRSIPLLVLADPPVTTADEARRSGKLVVLLIGNIHAGEVCGKEALPMLAREVLARPSHPLLRHLVLALVPNLNADGNERVSTDNRPGQVGPERGMGQRENAAGLDLNRDFVKLAAPETRALVRFLNDWEPHVVIDTHTTNGSHHRYAITYQGPQNPAGDPRVAGFVRETLLPAVAARFRERTGLDAYFYGNFEGDHARWTTFPATPRFGTNYVGLRHRISILSEAYAYAPYKTRVLATRDFVNECLIFLSEHATEVRRLLADARVATVAAGRDPRADDRVAVGSRARAFDKPVTVLGVVERQQDGRWVPTDEPKSYQVELVHDYRPTTTVPRPFAYLVPPRFTAAIETLRRHGIAVEELREDLDLEVEARVVRGLRRADREFEGHRVVMGLEVKPKSVTRRVPAGTMIVRAAQPLGTLAVYLLEPQSDDGLHTWNGFGNAVAVGAEFPVLRLLRPALLETVALGPLRESGADKTPITFDNLARLGGRGRPVATPRWLDGEHLLQVKDGRLQRVDAASGQAEPFHDPEALAKALGALPAIGQDAARALARRPSFTMNPDKSGALFEHDGDLYFATFDGKTAVRLTKSAATEELPSFSPSGQLVAFIRDNDLHVVDLASQTERALTQGGTDLLRNGKADWVYYEEIFNRNWKAYWWSPDSARIAFMQFDDAPVAFHEVVNDVAGLRLVERTPYPRSGDPNPRVRLGLAPVGGGPLRWADLAAYDKDSWLISHVGWFPDGQAALAQVQNRTQTWLDLVRVPVGDEAPRALFRETTRAWVESLGDPRFLKDGSFLISSERDGWKHLYHYTADGALKRRVTSGDWEVRALDFVDEEGGWAYFSATKDNPIATNLYRVKLDGGAPERLTRRDGSHTITMSPDGRHFLDAWSDLTTPTRVALHRADGELVRTLDSNPSRLQDEYRFAPRERVQIKTKDGFTLEGELMTPTDLDADKLYPVWFETYAGPHFPSVTDSWAGGRLRDQALASEGFVVFRMDPRSASGKGAVSAWSAYKRLGVQELEDIKEGIAWLKQKPYVDGARIGMAGHSYGGYMTAFAMTHSDLFACGIAGAPVTDWRDYDSIYTERYMLTPQENPEGYDASSVVAAAKNLHGRLLIVHGAIDDNVSVRNTMRLVHALQQADKDFELMLYPSSRHGIFGRHYNRLQIDFIRRTLGGPKQGPRAGR